MNVPNLWRWSKFFSFNYPITNVASFHGQKPVNIDLKKYLNGDADTLSRVVVRIFGNIVKAGAGPGAASGADNPGGLFVSANLTTSPIYANCLPVNSVSGRGLRVDGILNAGGVGPDDPQAFGGSTPITDAAATSAVDLYTEINFKRNASLVRQGVEYGLPLAKYNSAILQIVFGGRDTLITGGTNTWDLSGLSVEVYADIDMGVQPKYIHAHEIFENNYPILATTGDFRIDNLPAGFVYTDLAWITEDGGVPVDGILNNVSLFSGSNVWLPKGEKNAQSLRYGFTERNGRTLTQRATMNRAASIPGLFAIPMRDRMFTRAFDARFTPLGMSLDVTTLSATSNIRLVGRRMLPGGIYHDKSK